MIILWAKDLYSTSARMRLLWWLPSHSILLFARDHVRYTIVEAYNPSVVADMTKKFGDRPQRLHERARPWLRATAVRSTTMDEHAHCPKENQPVTFD